MIVKTYDDDDFRVHTLPLIAIGSVVALTLALAISTSLGVFERQGVPEQIRAERGVKLADTRDIKFGDAADGSVIVVDAQTGNELGRYPQGEGGFVRATARAMWLAMWPVPRNPTLIPRCPRRRGQRGQSRSS